MLLSVVVIALAGVAVGLMRQSASVSTDLETPPTPALPMDSLSGTYTPLATLDLRKDGHLGDWQWLDGLAGGTLAVAYTKPSALKLLRLPVQPGARAFDLSCELLFEHRGGELSLLFPAGAARLALVLELYDTSGLELIAGADWMKNPTTVTRLLPYGRFLPLTLKVRPDGARVAITVTLDGAPFIQWEGPQSDLALPPDHAQRHLIANAGPVVLLASGSGAVMVRDVTVVIAPEGK